VTELSPCTSVAVTTPCGEVDRLVVGVRVNVAEPVVETKPLIRYRTSVTGMVSDAVPRPVVKSVEETVAVHPVRPSRSSVTWTTPSPAPEVPPGAAAPRSALAGALIESTPVTTGTLALQRGSELPGGQLLPGVAELTVLARLRSPV
jgi:hypothetical protein